MPRNVCVALQVIFIASLITRSGTDNLINLVTWRKHGRAVRSADFLIIEENVWDKENKLKIIMRTRARIAKYLYNCSCICLKTDKEESLLIKRTPRFLCHNKIPFAEWVGWLGQKNSLPIIWQHKILKIFGNVIPKDLKILAIRYKTEQFQNFNSTEKQSP